MANERKYLQCPGGMQLGFHTPNVFLDRRATKKAGSVCFDCIICQLRIFGRGHWATAPLLGADQCWAIMAQMGAQAIDGRAQPIPL